MRGRARLSRTNFGPQSADRVFSGTRLVEYVIMNNYIGTRDVPARSSLSYGHTGPMESLVDVDVLRALEPDRVERHRRATDHNDL